MLLYLPLAHNFGRLMHLAGPYVGFTIAFLPDPLARRRRRCRRSGRRSSRACRASTRRCTRRSSRPSTRRAGVKRRLVDWALRVGRRAQRAPPGGGARCRAASRSSSRSPTGSSSRTSASASAAGCATPISGGAPLAPEIAEFFDALGIRILEGYGLTECTSAATIEHARPLPLRHRRPGASRLRAAASTDDGELLIRSETVFAGYYQRPRGDAEVLDRRRLAPLRGHRRDRRGRLRPHHRPQEGHPRSPPAARTSPRRTSRTTSRRRAYISQALVVGDRRPFVAALITLDPDEIGKLGRGARLDADVEALAPTSASRRSSRRRSTTSTPIARASSSSSAS